VIFLAVPRDIDRKSLASYIPIYDIDHWAEILRAEDNGSSCRGKDDHRGRIQEFGGWTLSGVLPKLTRISANRLVDVENGCNYSFKHVPPRR
jgi:hypothetical protein